MTDPFSLIVLVLGTLFLAWSNGANDNFKGVATLYGSGTADYRHALIWATGATLAGSFVSVALAGVLAKTFSGAGLVPDALINEAFLASVGLGAAITIALATVLGMPTSTTHALTGALVGVGLTTAGSAGISWSRLLTRFGQPLVLSPVLAIGLTVIIYPLLARWRVRLAIGRESHLSVETTVVGSVNAGEAMLTSTLPTVGISTESVRRERYSGTVLGWSAQRVVDAVHYASGGAVCFARAVNDTPKIAALLLAVGGVGGRLSFSVLGVVALAIAGGGWVQSRRVAETMSNDITDLNSGQGLTANLVTAGLVLGASRLGVPVSTTHVSCGAIFGIGWSQRNARWSTISKILATWLTTLPLGAVLGALVYRLLTM